MEAAANDMTKLIRKQFLISGRQAKKLTSLATSKGTSVAEIVRLAIDAYDPDSIRDMKATELAELTSQRLKEAIKSTQQANKIVSNTLKKLENGA